MMRYSLTMDDEILETEVRDDGMTLDGVEFDARISRVPGTPVHLLRLGDRVHRVHAVRREGGIWQLSVDGRPIDVEVVDERTRRLRDMTRAAAGPDGPRPLKAPMPGLVLEVEVEEGDAVDAGQGLVIVEAMKMENELKAEVGARVTRILVQAGETVEKDQVLMELGPLDDGDDP
jgi:pyruvate carboxylase subunit B